MGLAYLPSSWLKRRQVSMAVPWMVWEESFACYEQNIWGEHRSLDGGPGLQV